MQNFGIKLKRLREVFGFSQEYVAFYCGISQAAYCKKENGEKSPSLERLSQIATLYEISVSQLIELDISELCILAHETKIRILRNK